MNGLLHSLFVLTGQLRLAAGTRPSALADVRRMVAASLIQANPGMLPIVPDPNADALQHQAAVEGERLAAELNRKGIRLRFVEEPYLAAESNADRPARVLGPFIDDGLALVQFAFYESTPFFVVKTFIVSEFALLLLPQSSAADPADPSLWHVASGTVWIRAYLLGGGFDAWAGLRVDGGTLRADGATALADGVFVPAPNSLTLTVAPEPAPAAFGGSHGDAVSVTPPTELRVQNLNRPPALSGPLAMSGFGSNLRFDVQSGSALVAENTISFPFETDGVTWTIAANASPVFDLEVVRPIPVSRASWVLPLAAAPSEPLGEAAHGGSLALQLGGGLRSHVTGTTGTCRWGTAAFTVNARGIEMRAPNSTADVTIEPALWGEARIAANVSAKQTFPGIDVRHASRRGGADIATFKRGRVRNFWDLPRAASGTPFEFDGSVETLSLIAERDGRRRAAIVGVRSPDPVAMHGYVLENLYLHVPAAKRMAVVGSGMSAARLTEGHARLLFDVRLAQPMLPHPYAANWSVDPDIVFAESALRADIEWVEGKGPALRSTLYSSVALPDPPSVDDPERSDLFLLDVSGRDNQFGVALASLPEGQLVSVDGNVLRWPLGHTKLLMLPQVLWEPVEVVANPKVGTINERVQSSTHGGPTLVNVFPDTVELVPVLPRRVALDVASAPLAFRRWNARFGLPFGLRAFVNIERPVEGRQPPQVDVAIHEPVFADRDGAFVAAAQLRVLAAGSDPSRTLPGSIVQEANLLPNQNGLPSVLADDVRRILNTSFSAVPLHHADLSGYGLSTFSHWRRATPEGAVEATGVTEVRFDVVVGRTSYEVIELQSRLWHPQARVVRTVVLERGNSGTVYRHDSGWVPIDDGNCQRYAPIATGVVDEYRNIRNIRILPKPLIAVESLDDDGTLRVWKWQEVLYDADLHIVPDPEGAHDGHDVPIRDHTGYIQIEPVDREQAGAVTAVPKPRHFEGLMLAVGHPIGGPMDATVLLGGTLAMHLSHLAVGRVYIGRAPIDPKFALAVSGAPTLPRAGQWTAVAIDRATHDVSPVDPRYGLPVVRPADATDFIFRDPRDAFTDPVLTPKTDYGLLQSTPAARVLFANPRVNPRIRGQLITDPPKIGDPCALALATGMFPRSQFTLNCAEPAQFKISDPDGWKLTNAEFTFSPPAALVAQGAGWLIHRQFPPGQRQVGIDIDSINPTVPWALGLRQPDELRLNIAPFTDLFVIRSAFTAASGSAPGFEKPTVEFGNDLRKLKEILNALDHFVNLGDRGLKVDVDVAAGNGPSPSFLIRLDMRLRLPAGVAERVDIGLGKLRGQFDVTGRLQATPSGATTGQLSVELSGDLQQGIIPPVLFAGGQFRFVAQVTDSGTPRIEMGFGTAASIGGALIKNLIELEATVRYGYTLIPETLQPGVMLGIEARAKLLAGLLGLSFSADAMARIERFNDTKSVTIWAEIRVAATVQIAVFIKERVDFRTQFEQKIPLAAVALAAGAPLQLVAAAEVLRD